MNTFVNIKNLSVERTDTEKLLNTILNHLSLSMDNLKNLRLALYDNHKDWFKDQSDVPEAIQQLHRVTGRSMFARYNDETIGDVLTAQKVNLKNSQEVLETTVFELTGRLAAIDFLIAEASKLDLNYIKAAGSAEAASRVFRYSVNTIRGYNNKFKVIAGEKSKLTVKEEPITGWRGNVTMSMQGSVEVDHTWWDDVHLNDIAKVDIGGKACLTLEAEEIMEHELLCDDVRLFQAKVLYTKMPSYIDPFRMKANEAFDIVHVEDKVIAIQNLPDSSPIITTGKNQSWAVRTMKGRMKKKIVDIMGIFDD